MAFAAAASDLSSPKYGYDFVLSTTQDAINATMKLYLNGMTTDTTYICYTADDKGTNTLVPDYNAYISKVKFDNVQVDPFDIPANVDSSDARLAALSDNNFSAAIKITMGLPNNFDDITSLPPIVTLQDGVAAVNYNMMCAEIVITQMQYGRRGVIIWQRLAQSDQPNVAWILNSSVNMKLDAPISSTSPSFANLPQNVKDGIKNLDGSMFGVQQLLFDLNNAGLSKVPSIKGLDDTTAAADLLRKFFIGGYFGHMSALGQPVLNYTVIHTPQASSLKPTDLLFGVSPLVGQLDPGLQTLNYLCSTAPHTKVPAAVNFSWDWMNGNDAKNYHGVIAINRNTFTNYLLTSLLTDARNDCFVPVAKCYVDGLDVVFNAYADNDRMPNVLYDIPQTGSNTLNITYSDSSYDQAGLDGALGHVKLSQNYTKTVTSSGNTVTVVTHQVVYLEVRALATTNSANITDKTNTDVFTLSADGNGNMQATVVSTLKDDSQSDSANWLSDLFTNINDIFDTFASRQYTYTPLKADNIQAFQDFIFPGGYTFAFQKIGFSDYQDLLAAITYADP